MFLVILLNGMATEVHRGQLLSHALACLIAVCTLQYVADLEEDQGGDDNYNEVLSESNSCCVSHSVHY